MTRLLVLPAILICSLSACSPNKEQGYALSITSLADSAAIRATKLDRLELRLAREELLESLRGLDPDTIPPAPSIRNKETYAALLADKLAIAQAREDAELLVPPDRLRPIHEEILTELKELDRSAQLAYSTIACAGYGCQKIQWDGNGLYYAARIRRTSLVYYKRTRDRLTRALGRQGTPIPPSALLDSLAPSYPEWKQ